MKFYAVANGRKRGLYRTWNEAKVQITNYRNAKYKSFLTRQEAMAYLIENGVVEGKYEEFRKEAAMYDRKAYLLQFMGTKTLKSSGTGAVLRNLKNQQVIWTGYQYLGEADSRHEHEIEYAGLIFGLQVALSKSITDIVIQSDKQWLVDQLHQQTSSTDASSAVPVDASANCLRVLHLLPYFDCMIDYVDEKENSIAKELAMRAVEEEKSGEKENGIALDKNDRNLKRKRTEAAETDDKRYLLKFDGGSRGNPGVSGCGAVLFNLNNDEEVIWSGYQYVGDHETNNAAEYAGLILGLQAAKKRKIESLIIKGDSQLLVKQIKGEYAVKSQKLRPYYKQVIKLLPKSYHIEHVFRNENKIADALANIAMGRKQTGEKENGICQ